MKYTIDYLEDKEIVQIVNKGRVNFKLAEKFSAEAIKLAHEYNCRKYLINHSKTLSEDGVYKLHTDGDALEKFGFKAEDKVAIIVSHNKDDHYFKEATDTNAKWCTFKYFDSTKDAILWLAGDE